MTMEGAVSFGRCSYHHDSEFKTLWDQIGLLEKSLDQFVLLKMRANYFDLLLAQN